MGKKLNEHIGFYGNLSSYGELEVKFSDRMERYGWREGSKYIGEWSKEKKQPHGRGILIRNDVQIEIGQYNNGHHAPGNYFYIHPNKSFEVGERYMKNKVRWIKSTTYNSKDNTTEDFNKAE